MKGWFPVPEDFNDPDPELEDALGNNPIFPELGESASFDPKS
jgi:hypothetical protein